MNEPHSFVNNLIKKIKRFSNAMNLQIKCDCIRKVYESFCKLYTKVSDYKSIFQKIDTDVNSKIDQCQSNMCLTKEAWYFLKKLRN